MTYPIAKKNHNKLESGHRVHYCDCRSKNSSVDITATNNAINKQLVLSFSKYIRKYISEYILKSYKKMRLEKQSEIKGIISITRITDCTGLIYNLNVTTQTGSRSHPGILPSSLPLLMISFFFSDNSKQHILQLCQSDIWTTEKDILTGN